MFKGFNWTLSVYDRDKVQKTYFYDKLIIKLKLKVVSTNRMTAFYVVLVPLELIPSEPPLCA